MSDNFIEKLKQYRSGGSKNLRKPVDADPVVKIDGMVVLESRSKKKPVFECEECGFADVVGMFVSCPLCDPGGANCPFLRQGQGCGLDARPCPHVENLSFDACEKRDSNR